MAYSCAFCRPCKKNMDLVENEAFGQVYRCEECGATVTLCDGRPAIILDRMPAPPATTLNGASKL